MAVYGAFWDESGVNKDDPWLTVAGLLSTTDHWVEFTADWQDQMERLQIPRGVFHASRLHAPGATEYAGWTLERRRDATTALVDVIQKHVVGSVAISVPGPTFRAEMAKVPPKSNLRGQVGHPYAIAGRLCMVEAAGLLRGNLKLEGAVTLNHLFASGADGYGQLMTVADYESFRPARVSYLSLGTFGFGAQQDNPPLQAADLLAWELNRWSRTRPTGSAVRENLRRLQELPHRWGQLGEEDIGAQMMMSILVGAKLPRPSR